MELRPNSIREAIEKNLKVAENIQKELHNSPELSFEEYKTQEFIRKKLTEWGIENYPVAKTGVIGVINNSDECIAIRADMDAILVDGKPKHACGHDFHMAIVLGVAKTLVDIGYKKCVKFIFQPAEEGPGGAKKVIEEGGLKNPDVKKMIGFHVWPNLDVGKIEISNSAIMASVDDFEIEFIGKGGHAAMPELTKNPIYPAIDFIQSANNFFCAYSKKTSPFHVSFSSICSGETYNVIANTCKIKGTVRTFDSEVQKFIYESIQHLAKFSAQKYNCQVNVNYYFQYPPLINNPQIAEEFSNIAKRLLDSENVKEAQISFTAEDFAFYCQEVPSLYFRLGIRENSKGENPLHSPFFDASEKCIFYGIYLIVNYLLTT
ncbi:M20 family metallopeptidase [Caldicellulosiruptor naganoensis]|uniref:M20 family metallopeptidase n=1 Tax=Caldicellulosiruptor naganoensis TaxID=29324 RepID=A0ABY7BHG3_9FIRM|nr:M20 family metallopeptidase [Caldicellulosiruptor naganoensis]WAM32275.1 M20 family metallopeptidase [Caldicellulosiruptor naganoensis]